MARKPRIEFPGAVYHIMSRGDRGEAIVDDEEDARRFFDCVGEVCEKTGWRIHAFCLLRNHYHLLCETPEANLVAGMKWLQGTYTQRYNSRHRQRGHLFQGRYKALLIDGDGSGYFRRVSTYIHLNPLRAGLINPDGGKLEDYVWSSYPLYLKSRAKRPAWLETERVFCDVEIPRDDRRGRRQYASYMEGLVADLRADARGEKFEKEWKGIRRGWYLGRDEFRDKLQDHLSGLLESNMRDSYDGGAVGVHDENAALHIIKRVLEGLKIDQEQLRVLPKNESRKIVLAWVIKRNTTMTNRWISTQLNMGHISNVSNYVRQVEQTTDIKIRDLRYSVIQILES